MKLLLYCTKAKPYLIQGAVKPMHTLDTTNPFNFNWKLVNKGFSNDRLNGKIVGECDYEVEKIKYRYDTSAYKCNNINDYYYTNTLNFTQLEEKSCLTNKDLLNYLGQNDGYAIHIKNLHIFDEPRELDDCEKYTKPIFDFTNTYYDDNYYELSHITKAPQNMCKVKLDNKPYVLISIQPEWLCKILNGEKTIEVRRKVLKEMLK